MVTVTNKVTRSWKITFGTQTDGEIQCFSFTTALNFLLILHFLRNTPDPVLSLVIFDKRAHPREIPKTHP